MAQFTVGTVEAIIQSQLSVGDIGDGTITGKSATAITIDLGEGEIITIGGTGFQFLGDVPIGGTVTSIESRVDGVLLLRISGFSVTAQQFALWIDTDDTAGAFATIFGSADIFAGGTSDDLLQGLAGNDSIEGLGGHDNLFGGSGSDTLIGGEGNDHLYGQSANGGSDSADNLSGGGGSDYLQGNAGSDTLDGGDGSDRINGGADGDSIIGGAGNDTVNGNLGNDTIGGGADNDSLRGGQGNDSISGEAGNDVVQGDLGADTLSGGAGSDIFAFTGTASAVATPDLVTDFADDTDRLSLGFTPSVILTGAIETSLAAARVTAQNLINANAAVNEVVALGVGADTYLFYATGAGSTIDAAIQLSNVVSAAIGLSDFL